MFSDAHLHLHETGKGYPGKDIGLLFSCTAEPSEWDLLKSIGRDGLKRFYGVHPWYCDQWTDESRNKLLALLANDASAGVGEIGLDSSRGDLKEQIPVFCEQLDIASSQGRAVNIHMIGAEKETVDCLTEHAGRIPAVIHSFRSESYVKPLSALNCYFSVNPRILAKKPGSVRRIVRAIPSDRLLLESDAPHAPEGFAGMEDFISQLAGILDVAPEDLASSVNENLRSIA